MKILTYLLLTTGIATSVRAVLHETTQPTNSSLIAIDDDFDPEAEKRLEKYGKSLDTIGEVANTLNGIVGAMDDGDMTKKLKKGMAVFGACFAVMNIVIIFLPKQPSPEERALKAAVDAITKRMDLVHGIQMEMMSQIGRNQFFLHNIDKIETLSQLNEVYLAFRGRYNDRAVTFVCDEMASECSNAFRDWSGTLIRNFDQLMRDGPQSQFEGISNIGYQASSIQKEIDTSVEQLGTFPRSLQWAITGAAAYRAKRFNSTALPAPDLVSLFFVDYIQLKRTEVLEHIRDNVYPYLMTYESESASFGDRGDKMQYRDHRKNMIIKGFHQDKDTYLGSIVKLIWAGNKRMKILHSYEESCWSNLDANGGRCHCPRHSFLRGNEFSKTSKFIAGWEKSFCNILSGYFTKSCEEIKSEGTNKVTVCPMNKFWTGVYRESGKGLDQVKFMCCEADYQEPLTGDDPLPSHYKVDGGKFAFKISDGRILGAANTGDDTRLYSKNVGTLEKMNIKTVDAGKGLYTLSSDWGKSLYCNWGQNELRANNIAGDSRKFEFQFFEKDGGFAIYNPFAQRFLGEAKSTMGGCLDRDFKDAVAFYGLKRPMDERYRLVFEPILFRTSMTAQGEQAGLGFERSFISKWFAFMHHDSSSWMRADKDDKVTTYKNVKPTAWEKFEIRMVGKEEDSRFVLKSFHGKHLRCLDNGQLKADNTGNVGAWEELIFYQTNTNAIKMYNPHHDTYVKVEDNGSLSCSERDANQATEWSTPSS